MSFQSTRYIYICSFNGKIKFDIQNIFFCAPAEEMHTGLERLDDEQITLIKIIFSNRMHLQVFHWIVGKYLLQWTQAGTDSDFSAKLSDQPMKKQTGLTQRRWWSAVSAALCSAPAVWAQGCGSPHSVAALRWCTVAGALMKDMWKQTQKWLEKSVEWI